MKQMFRKGDLLYLQSLDQVEKTINFRRMGEINLGEVSCYLYASFNQLDDLEIFISDLISIAKL